MTRRLGLAAAACALALGLWTAAKDSTLPPVTEKRAAAPVQPTGAAALEPMPPPPAPSLQLMELTPVGSERAFKVAMQNPDTRRVLARLRPLGLSREQLVRVLPVLGAFALRPPSPPAREALRASGRTGALPPTEARRLLGEDERRTDLLLRSLRPALASVLTHEQLASLGN